MIGTARTGVILAVLLGSVACGGTTTSGRLREKVDSLDYPERELRLRLMDYTRHFSRSLARMSEKVLVATDDPLLRARILTARIHATALCQAAAFQPEPLAGLIDTWTLAIQLRRFVESENGSRLFEELQPLVVETLRRLEGQLDEFARFLPDSESGPARLREWAVNHPLLDDFGFRPSPAADLAAVSGDPELTAFSAIENLDEQVAVLSDRFSTLTVLIPELVRAEALLITERTMARDDLTATRHDIRSAADSLERLAKLDERIVELVETQRDVIAEKVRTEMQAVTAEVDRQRRDTLDAVTREREAVLASVDKQREETLSAITVEREAIVEAVDRETDQAFDAARKEWTAMLEVVRSEREQTMIEFEAMTESALARTHESGEELIDRLFLRLVQAGGGLIVLGAVAMFLIRRFAGRSAAA